MSVETMTLKDEARRLVAEIRAQGDEIPERDEHVANVLEKLVAEGEMRELQEHVNRMTVHYAAATDVPMRYINPSAKIPWKDPVPRSWSTIADAYEKFRAGGVA